ncbi:MAG: hypothetical protein AB7J13_06300 [Pyrinomonadaceae bacterium]
MKNHLSKKLTASLLALLLVVLQTGCVDLAGLRKFTDESVKAGSKFKDLAADNYRSCASQLYYLEVRGGNFDSIKIFESPDIFLATLPADRRGICTEVKDASVNFIGANKILMTYLYVMGQLAGDSVASTDKQFEEFRTALEGLPGNRPPEISAALSIANTITNILIDAQRQKAIKKALRETDESVEALTEGLARYLTVYVTRLENEREEIKRMFAFAHRHQMAAPNPSANALLVVSSSAKLDADVQRINSKINAAKAYQKALSGIRDGHRELYDLAGRGFNKKVALQIALKYGPAIQENYEEIVKAFE